MRRTNYTYGQLEKVLRAYGFTCRPGNNEPPGHIYVHDATGAIVMLPSYPESDKAFELHVVAARTELENFGIADAKTFDSKLQKTG